ncbi:hypothetical protein [Pedobacter ginsengisoli]|uniref:hypothetical protein n=1 Tax=Pedobacter ginsengisoli TaxID=363852 RepID=UPI002549DC75|nr:hypothetical protein [Pedobacter ginsengisoli]
MDAISIMDMLKTMELRDSAGELIPNEITFVTFSKTQGTGGKKITIKRAVIASGPRSKSSLRNPNHYRNYTRLLRDVDSDQVLKFRPYLVTRFNKRPIML